MVDTKRKKVVLLSGGLRLSGSTTWILNLHHGFKRLNVDVVHIVTNRPGREDFPDDFRMYYTGVMNKRLPVRLLRALRMHRWAPDLYQKVLDAMYDHAVSDILDQLQWTDHVDMVIKDFTAYLPPVLSNYMVVATIHQKLSVHWHHASLRNKRLQPASMFVGVSRHIQEDAAQLGMHVQKVIYNPIDADDIGQKATAYPVPYQNYILFVGSLHRMKGVYELLDAFSGLDISRQLVYVGNGPEMQNLHDKAVSLGVQDRVHFTGFVENPYPYIKNARLLVLPTYNDVMGYCVVEASVLSVPAIVTDFQGAKEFYTDESVISLFPDETFIQRLKIRIENSLALPIADSVALRKSCFEKMRPEVVAQEFLSLI